MREAEKAYDGGEVPTGCVIIRRPSPESPPMNASLLKVLARAHNQTESLKDPTAHAEILAITQAASALGDWRLENTVLIVTKEPCPMCAGAIVLARIPVVVYGLQDSKRGGISAFGILRSDALNHKAEIVGSVCEDRCREMFSSFFRETRKGAIEKPRCGCACRESERE